MSIRPTQLIIKNIGKIADSVIDINKPLILFYGEIRQGKSTILNCVRWVCGGEFPADIIKHGEKEGSIELRFDGGMIGRSFYRGKDDSTKARPVVFVRNGKPVPSPVSEIKRFLNPFLLDQDFLRNKSELERKQFFTELFAVDTTALDTELFNNQRDATALRAKISGYGNIDLTKVEPVDIAGERSKLTEIKEAHRKRVSEVDMANQAIATLNSKVLSYNTQAQELADDIKSLKEQLAQAEQDWKQKMDWLKENPGQKQHPRPEDPDTSALEAKIQEAGATNVRAEQYQGNQVRARQKQTDEAALSTMEKRGREIKAQKMAALKNISSTSGIEGLEFDEAGNFVYQGTTAGMISDSQIMRLSSELSALYPEGFGLDLIDRAESLGKSIFEFVDRAKAEKKTNMATIVGERPAKVPPEIGVFVVEDGKVKE